MELPQIGLGTYELTGGTCVKIVQLALELGYRHLDTAHSYENHKDIKKAIQGFDRSKIYITSKLAIDEQVDPQQPEASVRKACDRALRELGTEYLDLYLIHWPDRSLPMDRIFSEMQKLAAEGKIKKVGVSNFTIHHLEDLREAGATPFANQVEFHPYLYQQELLDYCRTQQIKLIAFRPFGKGKLLKEEPLFEQIGKRHGKTGFQVILRWLIQKKISVVPKASSKKHLQENIEILDFSLTQEEMTQLDGLNKNRRYCVPDDPEFLY